MEYVHSKPLEGKKAQRKLAIWQKKGKAKEEKGEGKGKKGRERTKYLERKERGH